MPGEHGAIVSTGRTSAVRQVAPLVLTGAAICFLGEMVQNLYLLMTALLMANYGMWISCLMSIDVQPE